MFLNEKTEAKMSDFTPDMSACVDEVSCVQSRSRVDVVGSNKND
jgi:hypothetical protein